MEQGDDEYENLVETLRSEAAEQVESMGRTLVELEKGELSADERQDAIDEAFRHAHNLKGAAGSLGFTLTARLAHSVESLLQVLREVDTGAQIDEVFDALHAGLTAVPEALTVKPGIDTHPAVEQVLGRIESATDISVELPAPPAPQGRVKVTRRPPRPSKVGSSDAPSMTFVEEPSSSFVSAEPIEAAVAEWEGGASLRPGSAGAAAGDSLRVSTRKLEALMTQVAELLGARLRADQRLLELREVLVREEARLERYRAVRAASGGDDAGVNGVGHQRLADVVAEESEHKGDLVKRLRELVRALESDALQSAILSSELQEDIRRIQTFPLSSVLDPLHRAVRNMAREANKAIDLKVEGADVELDKKVLAALKEPLQHLLRNAVDHGVESPEERQASVKPDRGLIRVRAQHRGNSIVITVSDDGAGIDLELVRKRAVESGRLTEHQAAEASRKRLIELIFASGMTTRRKPTELSGRGVGLDVVRSMIEELRGTVGLDTTTGRGTSVTIVLPVTIYVVHSLMLKAGAQRFAVPISSVQRILRVRPQEVVTVEQSEAIVIDGRPSALIALTSLLGLEQRTAPTNGQAFPAIVIGLGKESFAIAVDDIIGDDTLLAKNFAPPLVRVRNISGAAVLGDGSVMLMLNPIDLLKTASARELPASAGIQPKPERRPRILLADDTFTTRALERSVLENAGFDVVACADGREALAELESGVAIDVVVSDVSMPNMNGLELCEQIRADERFQTLPVVLVTSLESQDDRQRGLLAGADVYLAKSQFDHEELVAMIDELLGRP